MKERDLYTLDPRRHGRETPYGNPYSVADDALADVIDELGAARLVVARVSEILDDDMEFGVFDLWPLRKAMIAYNRLIGRE